MKDTKFLSLVIIMIYDNIEITDKWQVNTKNQPLCLSDIIWIDTNIKQSELKVNILF